MNDNSIVSSLSRVVDQIIRLLSGNIGNKSLNMGRLSGDISQHISITEVNLGFGENAIIEEESKSERRKQLTTKVGIDLDSPI